MDADKIMKNDALCSKFCLWDLTLLLKNFAYVEVTSRNGSGNAYKDKWGTVTMKPLWQKCDASIVIVTLMDATTVKKLISR